MKKILLLTLVLSLAPPARAVEGLVLHHPTPAISEAASSAHSISDWQSALQASPERLDYYFHLARLYQKENRFDLEYQVWVDACKAADRHWRSLRWIDGEKLPHRSSRLIPEALQDSILHYFQKGNDQNDEHALRLAKLSYTFYPRHPAAYNSIAAYFALEGDWEHSLKYLLMASQQAPKDSLVLNNIGFVLAQMGKKKEARIYYQRVVRLNNDEENTRVAQERLERLRLKKTPSN